MAQEIPGLKAPGRLAGPHVVMRQWLTDAVQMGIRQASEVYRLLRITLKPWTGLGDRPVDAHDLEEIGRALAERVKGLPIEPYRRLWEAVLTASILAGVLNAERVGESMRRRASSRSTWNSPGKYLAASDIDAFRFRFVEAIDALRRRISLPSDVFEALTQTARSRAGRIAGFQNADVVKGVYELIAKTLEGGGTFHDFDIGLRALPESRGWAEDNPYHAVLVFQQNMSMAFESGARRQYLEAGAIGWIWREEITSCPLCEPYVDLAFTLSGTDPYPGFIHFGCDCFAVPAFEGLDDASQLVDIATVPNPEYDEFLAKGGTSLGSPDNFGDIVPMNLADVPQALQSAFAEVFG